MKKNGKAKRAPRSKSKSAKSRLGVVNVKMTPADRKHLITLAKRHAGGNLSAWLRYAGSKYTPKKGEKVPLKSA